ncbi:MAG TPA: LON peptidase substrate-binding domain-containing protein [Casimicrobiaceae bacterium]|nr:LON peptidase substrate-binding domain-containing protein [Casimicrobiaceae bacterium]
MRVPLFPLKTVLFPGGVLPLKVFEQRYVDMTKACLANDTPFGVCLMTSGEEVLQPGASESKFASIGTLAKIVSWDMPRLGILHVVAKGSTRFIVESQATEPSGLVVADVRLLAAEPSIPVSDAQKPLVRLLELIETRVGVANFPTDPAWDDGSWVGYRLAEFLPLPLSIKQSMLEINDAGVRLQVLQKFLGEQGIV